MFHNADLMIQIVLYVAVEQKRGEKSPLFCIKHIMFPLIDDNLIVSKFENENYIVSNISRKNRKIYIDCICPNNHKINIRYDCFQRNRRCGQCYKDDKTYSLEKVIKILEKENYEFLDDNFINVKTAFNCLCPQDHKCRIYLTHWLKGHRCRECGYEISAEKNRSKNPDRELLKIKQKLASSLRRNLKRFMNDSIGPNDKLYDIHNYTAEDFINHIKNHPNYENACKNERLSIDHIFPIKAFQDYGICSLENAWIINGLDNLQPLDRFENSRKNCKYDKEKFLLFLEQKGIYIK